MSKPLDGREEAQPMDKRLLHVDEAATLLNVSRWTIYRWVRQGRLAATKLAKGSLRIFHASVLVLIEQNRTAEAKPSKVPPESDAVLGPS